MKIGLLNLWLNVHRHKWEWHYEEYSTLSHGHEIKAYEKCIAPDCRYGGYRSVCWLECRNKPDVKHIK